MKLTIERAALADLMNRGGGCAERGTLPILANVRLVTGDGTLRATTTDLDLQAEAEVAAEVAAAGSATVDADSLSKFVGKLPANATISIEHDGPAGTLTVKAGRNRARLPTLPAGGFTDLDGSRGDGEARLGFDGEASFDLTGADLGRLFAKTSIAASTEATRFYLCGVFIHVADADLKAVATDGHMLLMTGIPLPAGAELLPVTQSGVRRGIIVPTATAVTALRLFGREDTVSVVASTSRIVFSGGTTRIVSKLIDGNFPDHERVIPQESPNRIILDRASCLAAVSTVEVFNDRGGGSLLECCEDDEGLAMAAGSSDMAGGADGFALAQAEFEGSVPHFGVSAKYLRNALNAFASDIVKLSIADSASPIRFTADHDAGVLGVVMPMRVGHSRLVEGGRS